jgi:hypothetical protein
MLVTLDLPDDIAQALASQDGDLSRRAIEALAIDGYKNQKLTQLQVEKLFISRGSKPRTFHPTL